METADPTTTEGLEVRTYFVRERNALLARADFGELYVDYYLHQGQFGYHHAPEHDGMLKEALAALTLHCASRPWNEAWAWTIHFREPLLNLFVTGDNRRGIIVGQIFTENVKDDGRNLFALISRANGRTRAGARSSSAQHAVRNRGRILRPERTAAGAIFPPRSGRFCHALGATWLRPRNGFTRSMTSKVRHWMKPRR